MSSLAVEGLMSVSEPLVKTVASNILWLKTQDKLSFSEVFEQPEQSEAGEVEG